MMKVWDARQSPKQLWNKFYCYKLRLSNGKALVITREAWAQFLSNLLGTKTNP